ncbi:hypothetical protein EMIT0P294_90003 [Pseudomonas sp. IT-P294]
MAFVDRQLLADFSMRPAKSSTRPSKAKTWCSGQLIPDTTLNFFFGPNWCHPTVELMGSNPVVPRCAAYAARKALGLSKETLSLRVIYAFRGRIPFP